MEILNQQMNVKGNNGNGRPSALREGDIHNARVVSRVSDREAILSIRGQEVRAKFDGKVPERDRINVQVQERTDQGVRVREVQGDSSRSDRDGTAVHRARGEHSAERILRELGHREPSKELVQSSQRLLDRGVVLTRESVNDLNRYIESGRGSERERADTVRMMAQKRLEPTASQIRSVHEALHGSKLSDQVKEITQLANRDRVDRPQLSADYSRSVSREMIAEAIAQVRSSMQSGQNIRQSIEQLQQLIHRSGDAELRQEVNQALREMIQIQAKSGRDEAAARMLQLSQQLQQSGQSISIPASHASITTAALANWQGMVQQESNLLTVLETVRTEMTQSQLSSGMVEQLNQSMSEATSRLEAGRELKARQMMVDAFQQLEQSLPRDGQNQLMADSKVEMQQYMRNEFLQTSSISSKSLIVTEVTERLAYATDQFKAFQRDISKQLTRIETMIQQFRQHAIPQTRPMLENVIQQLDRTIMKNDWMLFADMKTERRILGASSDLAQAKKLLAKGNYQEARQIVRSVQQTMDTIQFKPSNQRVQHFLTQEQEWRQPQPAVHRLSQQYDHIARSLVSQGGSARQVFEGMRGIGLTRESELAHFLASSKEIPQDTQQRNLKSILMQVARGEEEGSRSQQQAQQSLQHLAGQQLISRSDSQQNMQMMMLQLPVMLKGEAENLQVFVNSRNEGEQVDWENCNLYFYIETKKLGPLGISLNVSERSLSVTLKNDSDHFNEQIEPLAGKYIDNLKDVGYNVNSIKFAPMTIAEEVQKTNGKEAVEEASTLPIMTEKGFDYKI